jgi:hypothetical protein
MFCRCWGLVICGVRVCVCVKAPTNWIECGECDVSRIVCVGECVSVCLSVCRCVLSCDAQWREEALIQRNKWESLCLSFLYVCVFVVKTSRRFVCWGSPIRVWLTQIVITCGLGYKVTHSSKFKWFSGKTITKWQKNEWLCLYRNSNERRLEIDIFVNIFSLLNTFCTFICTIHSIL